jgi:hypothetical protein
LPNGDKYSCAQVCCKPKEEPSDAAEEKEHADHVVPLETNLILDDLDQPADDDDAVVRKTRNPKHGANKSSSLETEYRSSAERSSAAAQREAKSAYGGGGGKQGSSNYKRNY